MDSDLIRRHMWGHADVSDVAHTFASMGTLARDVASESYNFLFVGGLTYAIYKTLDNFKNKMERTCLTRGYLQ